MIIVYQIRQHKSTFIQLLCFSLELCERLIFPVTGRKLLPKGHNIYFNLLGDCSLKNHGGGLVMFGLDCRSAYEQSTSLLIASGVVCT